MTTGRINQVALRVRSWRYYTVNSHRLAHWVAHSLRLNESRNNRIAW